MKQKHPSQHQRAFQIILDAAQENTLYLPFTHQSQAERFRVGLYGLRRAHFIYETPDREKYIEFKSKIIDSVRAFELNPNISYNIDIYPCTLIIEKPEALDHERVLANMEIVESMPTDDAPGTKRDPIPYIPQDFVMPDNPTSMSYDDSYEETDVLEILKIMSKKEENK